MPRGSQRYFTADIGEGGQIWHIALMWEPDGTIVSAEVTRRPERQQIIDTTCRVVETKKPATRERSRALVVR